MKRSIVATIFLLVSTVILNSCSDYFDLDRPPQNPWNTVNEFERAPIGAYAGLFSGNEWNMAWVNERIVKSSMGDDVGFVENPEWGYNRNTSEPNKYTLKNLYQLYKVIATTNNALDFVNDHDGNPFPDASAQDIENNVNRIIGELHFVRAYAYYILETTFGHAYVPNDANNLIDIPMPTTFAKSAQEARNPKIGTTTDVYSLIVDDLLKAKSLLPLKYEAGKHHPSYQVRATRFAAASMLMRTYLQTGSYDSALAECNFVIDQNGGQFDLTEDPIAAFNKSTLARGKEVIFYAPFFDENLQVPNHLSVINQTWSNTACTWTETYMSFNTIKRLGWMNDPKNDTAFTSIARRDKRFSQLMTVRYPQNKHTATQQFDTRASIRNYTTVFNNKYYRGPQMMLTNVPLIRLAELYLTRSIIRFKKGDKSGAADDLNVVRGRAWDSIVGGAYVPVDAGTITEQMINDERVIELFNEGDRIDYLRGLKEEIPLGDRGVGADPYTSDHFIWAMPNVELNFNDAL